jgi:hypothetical protein
MVHTLLIKPLSLISMTNFVYMLMKEISWRDLNA